MLSFQRMLRTGCVAAACTSLVLTAPTWASPSAADGFTDNTRNSDMWGIHGYAFGRLTETNQRLEYTSTGSTGQDNEAHYRLEAPLPFDQAWTAVVDVHVGTYAAGTFTNPSTSHGMQLGIAPSADVHDFVEEWNVLVLELCNDYTPSTPHLWATWKCTDGNQVVGGGDHDGYMASPAADTGRLKLVWDGTSFTGYYDEGAGWRAFPAIDVSDWGMSSGSTFSLYLGGYDDASFTLSDGAIMYADNFVLVPEPVALSWLALGSLIMLRWQRKASGLHARQEQRNAP